MDFLSLIELCKLKVKEVQQERAFQTRQKRYADSELAGRPITRKVAQTKIGEGMLALCGLEYKSKEVSRCDSNY